MRIESSDHIELYFECGSAGGTLQRSDVQSTSHLRVEEISGSASKVSTGLLVVPHGMNVLCINLQGTLICRAAGQGRLIVAPPRSLLFVRSGRIVVQAARGEHIAALVTWSNMAAPLLEHWISSRPNGARNSPGYRQIASRPIDGGLVDVFERLSAAIKDQTDAFEPLTVSTLYEVVARLLSKEDTVQLAALPDSAPETVRDLIQKVRKNPASPWPLRDASSLAGYSPFHFSRVFKGIVGYGFHEYVDRCRTECAVELLCTTDKPVDVVASTCGFGTTQGLRESLKEYLGLVPSELRSVPDNFEITA